MTKITIETDENSPNEFERQLHEQYAINNNANLGSIVALIVALIVVFGYFGFVLVNTMPEFSDSFACLKVNVIELNCTYYYLDVLLLSYLISVFVLFVMMCLAIYQGIAQRKEQFITHAIRMKYRIIGEGEDRLFPNGYNPFNKMGLETVQGLYGELVKVFNMVFILISMCVLLKLISNFNFKYWDTLGVVEVAMSLIIVLVFILVSRNYYKKQLLTYIKRQCEYVKSNDLDNIKSLLKTSGKHKIINEYNRIIKQKKQKLRPKRSRVRKNERRTEYSFKRQRNWCWHRDKLRGNLEACRARRCRCAK